MNHQKILPAFFKALRMKRNLFIITILLQLGLSALLLVASQLPVGAQTAQAGCISGNCTNGYGTYVWESGNRYTGEWENNVIHGHGTYFYASGATYTGQFENGKMNGRGTYTWPNGDSKTGYWKDNKFIGLQPASATNSYGAIQPRGKILLFLKEGCGRSQHVERYLRNNNISFTLYNTTTNEAHNELMWETLREAGYRSGAITMPVVVVGDRVYYSIPDLNEFLSTLQ